MTSVEIEQRLNKLDEERAALDEKRAALETELLKVRKAEKEAAEKEHFNKTKAFIYKLWDKFWKDDDFSESKERLEKIKWMGVLNEWVKSDVAFVLRSTNLSALEDIKSMITEYGVDCGGDWLNDLIREAEIRLDFASALRSVKDGSDLSGKLRYCFGEDDLMELMKLHKSNRFRKKIEDLLGNCNYHSECGLLCSKKYDVFEKYVMEED